MNKKMKSKKQLGIWMDHSIAYLIKIENGKTQADIIEANPIIQNNEQNLKRDESLLYNKEHNQLSEFFKKLSEVIKEYGEVILFGPTEAKNELFNLLNENHLFSKIEFEVKSTDKMTENQRLIFVKNYFNI